jgi:hypothetical protein
MKYYILSAKYPDDSCSITGSEISQNYEDRYEATTCKILNERYLDKFSFRICQSGVRYDLLANNLSWLIVQERVKIAIENICKLNEVQFLPFGGHKHLERLGLGGYFLLNATTKVQCLDYKKSILSYGYNDANEKYISSSQKISISNERICGNLSLFRIAELDVYLIVDEKIVNILTQLRVTGCSFKLIETS